MSKRCSAQTRERVEQLHASMQVRLRCVKAMPLVTRNQASSGGCNSQCVGWVSLSHAGQRSRARRRLLLVNAASLATRGPPAAAAAVRTPCAARRLLSTYGGAAACRPPSTANCGRAAMAARCADLQAPNHRHPPGFEPWPRLPQASLVVALARPRVMGDASRTPGLPGPRRAPRTLSSTWSRTLVAKPAAAAGVREGVDKEVCSAKCKRLEELGCAPGDSNCSSCHKCAKYP